MMGNTHGNHGAPQYTNRLINESSPYLQHHAHNPVDWYPWGEEALAKAKAEDKPIHLSIGYSSCHWCSVLARESFEDPETARIMNENFVNIKVDREERPDLDAIYMQAVQAMTGHGGWPMTTFLTPEGEPFYGGTYFPPEPRYGMPSFRQVLSGVSSLWNNDREHVQENANTLRSHLSGASEIPGGSAALQPEILDQAFAALRRNYDAKNGGFGGAPKFPQPQTLEFLLRYHVGKGNPDALRMVEHTLQKMARGGIYDQLAGGFHRYSVDDHWLVPHFEKMLYDNAQLARAYLHAYQITGKPFYRRIVEETLDYVVREMLDPEGGFYSTQDADSEGVEGKFFVWTADETRAILGEDASLFMALFDVRKGGNWEGHTILNQPREPAEVARVLGVTPERLEQAAARGRRRLFEEREKRVHPNRDDKVLVSWNGLMLRAFASAGRVLDRPDYLEVARRNAEFVVGRMLVDGRLRHVYKDGQVKVDGFLEDYALYAEALIELYEATFDPRWISTAREWAEIMLGHFWDDSAGGFFQTSDEHEALITRPKDLFDEAVPSGNGVAANLLLRLAAYLGEHEYDRRARATIELVAPALAQYPTALGTMLNALDFALAEPREVAIIGGLQSEDTQTMLRTLAQQFLPNTVIAAAEPGDAAAAEVVPLLQDRPQREGRATAYVCRSFACQAPTTQVDELLRQLGRPA
jgi:uncharacterized protein YyaL (SSP411 family)